jgi:hypothetical protein
MSTTPFSSRIPRSVVDRANQPLAMTTPLAQLCRSAPAIPHPIAPDPTGSLDAHCTGVLASRSAAPLLVLLLLFSSCNGAVLSAQRVHIVSGILVYTGYSVATAIELHVDPSQAPTTFSWRVGAVTEQGLCRQDLGWRLDLARGSNASSYVAANAALDLRLRATSNDRPACDPGQLVARCGDPVRLLVMTGDDEILAELDTTLYCLLPAPTLR